ncbi:MAG: SUMF1/EgtB/PvdO family nonheme iron enzyme, partial [Thermoguttaceae bacterium]|nr:SUMF1/EgtB/PvdO family nonheme iron enzyme [Thermoguttaceae bacterium]
MSKTPMKKQALLIGINEYQILPELKYARQDAEAVEQALKQNYCFSDDEVMLLTDAKPGLFKPSNRRIIEKHLEKLAEQDLDLFIFGFWGHGLFRNGQRYFCPLDAISEDIEELGLSFDSLQRLLSNIKAKNTCMILDCCQKVHDRGEEDVLTAADQRVMENAARDIVLRRKETEPEFVSNVAILNSCKQGQAAYEWENRKHGIFTAHLLDALNRRYDSVAQIVGYISSHVEKTAMELGKTQTPFYKLEGDISLPVDTKSSPLVTGEVFVSYRHCNADLVAPVEEELKKRGISYFIDREGVNYGMEYAEALTQAIVASKLVLLFWTPEVKGSHDIVNEVTMALQAKKTVMPYKIGTFNPFDHPRLCYHLSSLSRYEVPAQTSATVTELVNRVEMTLSGKQPVSHVSVVLPEKAEDAVIEKPVIDDIEVSFTPEQVEQKTIQSGAIQLPPLPKELLDIQAENKGLNTAIEQLQTFTHESLAQANAALEQAQAQFQAWKERKEKSWENMEPDLRQSLEDCISKNPDCTEEDVDEFLDDMSNQEYFDFIEQFQCGKKYEQAYRELERVDRERQTKCDEVIAKVKKKIADNSGKIKDISDNFFNKTLMMILAVMEGYNELNAPFLETRVVAPLRQLDGYELGWRAKEMLSRARRLWEEQRPCVLETHDLSILGTKAGERKTVTVNGVEFAFRWAPAGTFTMGSPESEKGRDDRETLHQVTLTKGFWIMETQVTQKQWKAIMGNSPSQNIGNDLPVENVSWYDCQDFCKKCTQLDLPVQLPTEAQWEYACRADSTTAYFWGNALNGDKANCDGNYPCGTTTKGKYIGKTTPVGSYEANSWG